MSKEKVLDNIMKLLGILVFIVGITAVLNIPLYLTNYSPFNQQYQAMFWVLVATMIFLTRPASKKTTPARWYDLVLIGITLFVGLYIVIFYHELQFTLGVASPFRMVMGILTVLVLLESTRRVAGWPIVIIILVFMVYAKFGNYFPGLLETKAMTWKRLFTVLYLNNDSWLGIPLRVVLLIVFGFLLMGRVFFETGGGAIIIGFAEALMGRYRGGPAKVAVLASSIFGAMSGSTVGNVASTGVVTIPMMKKTGFSPSYAGAVETVASNGGQILPPVMGAAAFIMAEFLGVSYPVIVSAAIIPGILYYLAVFIQVHLQAVSSGMLPIPKEDRPSLKETAKKGWIFAIPIAFLVYVLFVLWMTPGFAALYTAGITVVVTLIKKETRSTWSWGRVMAILQKTSRTAIEVTAVSAAAGIVVGIVSYTGLGLTFSRVLTDLAGGHLILLAGLAAFASIILGMGMPPAPAYILLAVLAAPAFADMGVPEISAHLFVFYFGILSMVTPPVCIAVYTAASIAEASMMRCALYSMKLSIAAYIVPFVMLYNPGLNFIGSAGNIISASVTAAVGLSILAIALEGYFRRRLGWLERGLLTIAGIAMLVPNWLSQLVSVLIIVPFTFIHFKGQVEEQGT